MQTAASGATAASTSAITSDEILDLIYSVDKAYRDKPSSRLVMHDNTVKALRKLTVGASDDRRIWQAGEPSGAPSTIHGVPYIINNAMPQLTAGVSSKVMAFGDFSQFYIRQVGGLEIVRLNERFADSRAVGFFGYQRLDSKLLNANSVKFLALAAS
jgi:HK97 family phage major capsid protein